jgi:glycosyltransferase involved in cell wall biosynthesis
MNRLVSVIIPAFNSENYIQETLDSVLNQTWKNIEIIVVDDGSTDKTLEILEFYKRKNVQVITQNNRGACAARNIGYKYSKGEFIQFLDSDDPIAPDKIEKQVSLLIKCQEYDKILIHCRWGRFRTNIEEVYYWGPHADLRKSLLPADWLIYNRMSMTGCWLIHRNLINKAGLWNESLKRNQDGEFIARLMVFVSEVLYSDEARVYYRSGLPDSISNTVSRVSMESLLNSLHLIEKYLFILEVSPRAKVSIANRYQDFIYSNYFSYPDLAKIAQKRIELLGGSNLKLPGSFIIRSLAIALGWKNALRIKRIISVFRAD